MKPQQYSVQHIKCLLGRKEYMRFVIKGATPLALEALLLFALPAQYTMQKYAALPLKGDIEYNHYLP